MSTLSPNRDTRTLMERFSDALVYVIFFPFLVFGIAIKRAFTQGSTHRSYRNNLPAQKRI
jgi:hypothetical protein